MMEGRVMAYAQLPERPSLDYLKRIARTRLRELRRADAHARLADALLAVAREHGFASWRALKAEVERRQHAGASAFVDACIRGDRDEAQRLVRLDPALARASVPDAPHPGWTPLHAAAQQGRLDIVRLLLEHGADVDARESGDNTTALHWAAARGEKDLVQTLLDAGADVHGLGDVHALDVIGWCAYFRAPGTADITVLEDERRACLDYLVERGARHHIFSAICVGELPLIREVVAQNPSALERRMSRFERGLAPAHFAIERRRHDILELLIELGADLEATDGSGQTALAFAMLRGDREAVARLQAAGAVLPEMRPAAVVADEMRSLAGSITKGVPMIYVPDVAKAIDWYVSIGFTELARFADGGSVSFGMVAFGSAQVMLNMHGSAGRHGVSLWFYTDAVDSIYAALKARALSAAQAGLTGKPTDAPIVFTQDIEDMFYGARQFCIRDPAGYELYFIQDVSG
jgi:ankyrin repeat protein/catechol 2,3-dioxygenase-like lactoylglutathione lyase family enzyme